MKLQQKHFPGRIFSKQRFYLATSACAPLSLDLNVRLCLFCLLEAIFGNIRSKGFFFLCHYLNFLHVYK